MTLLEMVVKCVALQVSDCPHSQRRAWACFSLLLCILDFVGCLGYLVTPPTLPPPLQKMRYVAAYLLAALGGNDSPSKADLTKILESVGLDIDDDRLDKVSEF